MWRGVPPPIIKAAIIEDRRDLREGLTMLINGTASYQCVGSFRSIEKRLLKLLIEGNSKAIAPQLGVAVHTIGFHIQRIYTKLQAHYKSEAVYKAMRHRLV